LATFIRISTLLCVFIGISTVPIASQTAGFAPEVTTAGGLATISEDRTDSYIEDE
jgi:hypothetical protein